MIPALNSEFRKLVTTRSTWFLLLISFLLTSGLIGFWIYGFKDVGRATGNPGALLEAMFTSVNAIGVFFSFMAILLVGHEYRYNTIVYSLTSANRRTKVFFAKYIAVAAFGLAVAAALLLVMTLALHIGFLVGGVDHAAQRLPDWNFIWRATASVLGSITFAYIISMLIRSLTGAIAVVIVLPSFIEGILTLLLHGNVKYLPYTALGNLTQQTTNVTNVSVAFSLAVVCTYAVVLGAVACGLFIKRDAN